MNGLFFSVIVVFVLSSVVPVLAGGEKWKCSAKSIANYSYSGGERAMIRLSKYKTGGSYTVKRTGNVAKGETKDGTPFTCTKVG